MAREIKKEQGFLDALFGIPEKEVIYEDGRKIGEVRQETTLLGDRIERVYDAEGNKVLETRQEKSWLWGDVKITSDTTGNIISKQKEASGGVEIKTYDHEGSLETQTVHERSFLGLGSDKDITRNKEGKIISIIQHEEDWLGRPVYVEYKDSGEINRVTGQDSGGKRIRISHHKRNLAEIVGGGMKREGNKTEKQITQTDNYEPYTGVQKTQETPFSLRRLAYFTILFSGIFLIVGCPVKSYLDQRYRGEILRQAVRVADENKNGIVEVSEVKKVHRTLGFKWKEENYEWYEGRFRDAWGALTFLTTEQI